MSVFYHFESLPKELLNVGSVLYAQKYRFFGLFFISSFLFFNFFYYFFSIKLKIKKIFFVDYFFLFCFFINIGLNSKIIFFGVEINMMLDIFILMLFYLLCL